MDDDISAARNGWTPSRLIEVFCAPGLRVGLAESERKPRGRSDSHTGFCAYNGSNAYGQGIDGFDDGRDLWDALERSGWSLIQDPGDQQFPYTQYLTWRPRPQTPAESPEARWCIARYREGDLSVEVFEEHDAYLEGELAIRKFDGRRPQSVPPHAQLIRVADSEVCMHMRCAGKIMWAALLGAEQDETGLAAQLYTLEGHRFSSPILCSEAGLTERGSHGPGASAGQGAGPRDAGELVLATDEE